MKKFKSLIAALLAATMVLTMTGCDEEAGPTGSGNGGNDVSTPTANNGGNGGAGDSTSSDTTQSADFSKEMDDEAVSEAAKALVSQLSYPDLKVEKRIKWLSWWTMDESSGEALLFKEQYGVPATGDDPASDGRIFENEIVVYEARYDRLSTLIASDESPDIYPFAIDDFPYGILMNRYQAVDEIVDFNSAKWAPTKDLNDQFALKGKHYAAFWTFTLSDLLWYRKSNIDAIGKDDPQEMFLNGTWDWDAFLDIAREWQKTGTESDPRFAVDGWSADTDFLISTGVPLIGNDGGKLVSNLRKSEVERVITGLITTLQQENLRYPRHELNDWQYNPAAWGKDQILFFADGTWRYEDDLQVFGKKYKWPAGDIKVVPFPKDPNADKYYVQIKVDVPMWVKGSKNKEGVQAWLDCCVTASRDKTMHEASNQKMIKNPKQNYTQEILDFLDMLYGYEGESPLTPIVDFKTGLGPVVNDGTMEAPINAVLSTVYLTGGSFVQLREENESRIQAALDDINGKL